MLAHARLALPRQINSSLPQGPWKVPSAETGEGVYAQPRGLLPRPRPVLVLHYRAQAQHPKGMSGWRQEFQQLPSSFSYG